MKKIILISLICLVSAQILKSQVTVGSLNEPVRAALLDLKTKNADSENVTVESNKEGGLVLPRVKLENVNTLQPFIPTNSPEWKGDLDNTKKVHTGMMVYNLETGKGFSQGIYVWEGTQWVRSTVNATNGLTKTGNNIQLGGTLNDSTTIIQRKHSLAFTGGGSGATEGKIYLRNVKNNIPTNTDNIATLGIDGVTGELFTMKVQSVDGATSKSISYVVYELTGEGDWVRNFETGIKVKDYTLVVVGYEFSTQTPHGGLKPGSALKANATPISNVYADASYKHTGYASATDNWVIHADYAESAPSDNKHGTWTINCMIINNSLLNAYAGSITWANPENKRDFKADYAPTGLQ
jgi:hypothetical protein